MEASERAEVDETSSERSRIGSISGCKISERAGVDETSRERSRMGLKIYDLNSIL